MTKTFKILTILIVIMICPLSSYAKDCRLPSYTRYMGSFGLAMPKGTISTTYGYLNDNDNSSIFISQVIMNNTVEVSYLRHTSGEYSDENVLNCKLQLIEESSFMPSVVWGASDLTKQVLDDRLYFVAGSKSLDAFGLTIYGGYYDDPNRSHKVSYYGAEKVVFPLISVLGESEDDIFSYGVKLTPIPGLDLVIGRRDNKEDLFNICYYASF